MSERTRSDVDTFWRILAFLANTLIFLLIGVQVYPVACLLVSGLAVTTWGIALVAIGVVLAARLVLILALRARSWLRLPQSPGRNQAGALKHQTLPRSWLLILFWSGLPGNPGGFHVCRRPFYSADQGISLRWILMRLLTQRRNMPEEAAQVDVLETETDIGWPQHE